MAGRHWVLKVFLLSAAFSILFSGGLDLRAVKSNHAATLEYGAGYTAAYYQKIEHPLLNVARISEKDSHDEKQNFRLTVPVVLHVLGLLAKRTGFCPRSPSARSAG